MKETTNLKLKKPDSGDPVLISDLNENSDTLDTAVAGKLDKSGGTMTGTLSIGSASINPQGWVSSTWLQTTAAGNLNAAPGEYPVLQNGWLYKRTAEEMKADLGIGDALLKTGGAMTGYLADKNTGQVRNIYTSNDAPTDADGQDGDVWLQAGGGGGSEIEVITSWI